MNFTEMEQRLAEKTNCYENVAKNLEREVERRNQERLADMQKKLDREYFLKRMLHIIFLILCVGVAVLTLGTFIGAI